MNCHIRKCVYFFMLTEKHCIKIVSKLFLKRPFGYEAKLKEFVMKMSVLLMFELITIIFQIDIC